MNRSNDTFYMAKGKCNVAISFFFNLISKNGITELYMI